MSLMHKWDRLVVSRELYEHGTVYVFGVSRKQVKSRTYTLTLECGHRIRRYVDPRKQNNYVHCADCQEEFINNFSYSKQRGSLTEVKG